MEKQNRKRSIQMLFRVTPQERALIYHKMAIVRMNSFQAYARQMATNGYIVDTDVSELKDLAAELQKITVNIRQILKYVDTLGTLYAADAGEIRQILDKCWDIVRQLFKESMKMNKV